MSFTRTNPSPRYQELVSLYKDMHLKGIPEQGLAPEKLYIGASLLSQLPTIRGLVRKSGARTLLDYGSGKGYYYTATSIPLPNGETASTISQYLGVDRIRCYDPAVAQHATLPDESFDAVISTDALEHCPVEDVPWIVDEMFSRANRMVFANVASYSAAKTLPNGENAHATQQPAAWWDDLLKSIAARYPHVRYYFAIVEVKRGSLLRMMKKRKSTTILSTFD